LALGAVLIEDTPGTFEAPNRTPEILQTSAMEEPRTTSEFLQTPATEGSRIFYPNFEFEITQDSSTKPRGGRTEVVYSDSKGKGDALPTGSRPFTPSRTKVLGFVIPSGTSSPGKKLLIWSFTLSDWVLRKDCTLFQ
jgi:hypothetical protein